MDNLVLLIQLAVIVMVIAAMWTVFTKAEEPGWAAIVPFYNIWVLCRLSGAGPLWFILAFVPLVNIVAFIYIPIQVAISFGKGAGFGIGLALLGVIFYPILAWGDAEYVGPGGIAPLPGTTVPQGHSPIS